MTARKMPLQMRGHGFLVFGHKNSSLALGPEQQIRISRRQRQIRTVADASHVNPIDPGDILAKNNVPDRTAEIFVENISKHANVPQESGHFARFNFTFAFCLEARSEFRNGRTQLLAGHLLRDRAVMLDDVSISFRGMVEIKRVAWNSRFR